MADEPEEEENKQPEEAPKRRERQYMDTGEPSNKGFLVIFGVIIAIAALGFGYFMIFHFNDIFYEKKVVRINAYD